MPAVVHVSDGDQWSGGSAQLLALAHGLGAHGWTSRLACRPDSALAREGRKLGLPVFPAALRQDYDIFSALSLARFIVREGISVIHAHHSRSHGVCLLAKSFLGWRGPEAQPTLVVSRRVSFPIGRNPFSHWKYSSPLINGYIAVAQAVKDTLVAGGVEGERVSVIRSGVDAHAFSPRPPNPGILKELAIPANRILIGKIANASTWKGQRLFLQAAALLTKQGRDLQFLFAGRDTASDELKNEAKRLGLENRMRFMGFRNDVAEILSCLKVSVNAALQGEGLSGALRESLAMGIPVAASDVAGNQELFAKAGREFLFSSGSAEALAGRISWILDHPQDALSLVETWRKQALHDFSLEQTIEKTARLYARLCAPET